MWLLLIQLCFVINDKFRRWNKSTDIESDLFIALCSCREDEERTS